MTYDQTGTVSGEASAGTTDDAMTRSEEELRVGTEKTERCRARLRKYVTTEQQSVTVPVNREEVRVEREPITEENREAATSGPEISEDEQEVVLHEERPVVEKEAQPVERVRLGKEAVSEEEQVSEEVRKEQIEVDDESEKRRRSSCGTVGPRRAPASALTGHRCYCRAGEAVLVNVLPGGAGHRTDDEAPGEDLGDGTTGAGRGEAVGRKDRGRPRRCRDRRLIGACTALLGGEVSGLAEWIVAERRGVAVLLPAVDAAETGGQVRVRVAGGDALAAPSLGGAPRLSQDEEAALYRHYRIDRSALEARPASGEAAPSVVGAPPDVSAATPASTPSAFDDGVQGSAPDADPVTHETGEPGSAVRRYRRVLAGGALAGVAAIVAALFAARRNRNRRPPTPTERPGRRVHGASVAMTGPAVELGGSAAPVVRAAGRAVSGLGRRAARLPATAGASVAEVAKRGVHRGQQVGEAVESVPGAVAERSKRLREKGWAVMGKLTMGLALGAGYVLGARAGRQRFEQLKQAAERVRQRPEVQQAAEKLGGVAGEKLQTRTGMKQRASGFTEKLRRRDTIDASSGEQISPSHPPGPGMAGEELSAEGPTPQAFGPPDSMEGDFGARPRE